MWASSAFPCSETCQSHHLNHFFRVKLCELVQPCLDPWATALGKMSAPSLRVNVGRLDIQITQSHWRSFFLGSLLPLPSDSVRRSDRFRNRKCGPFDVPCALNTSWRGAGRLSSCFQPFSWQRPCCPTPSRLAQSRRSSHHRRRSHGWSSSSSYRQSRSGGLRAVQARKCFGCAGGQETFLGQAPC